MSSKEKQSRRRYTAEFKEQAVKRVLSGHPVAAMARELGVGESLIHNWLARHRQQTGAGAAQAERGGDRQVKAVAGPARRGGGDPKKGRSVLCQGVQVKYAWIKSQEGTFSVKAMCRVLNVRRTGYYAWKRPRPNDRQAEAKRLDEAIRRVFDAHKGRYGSPRVWEDLKAEGWRVGRPRVAKRMQALGLRARAARKYKATTQSKHTLPVAPNRLEQDFTASASNQKWVADITYLWTGEGWLYLAVVLDLYSRLVVGWSMGERITRAIWS